MVVVETDHPLQTLDLVIFEFATDKDVGLPHHFFRYLMGDRIIIHLLIVSSVVCVDLSTEGSLVGWAFFLFEACVFCCATTAWARESR